VNQLVNIKLRTIVLISLSGILGCTSTEPVQTKAFRDRNIPEHVFSLKCDVLKDTLLSMFSINNQLDNKILKAVFYEEIPNVGTMPLVFQPETSKDTRYSPVMATTIEEYTILEFIASKLGDSTLLPIKLPEN